MKAVSVTAQHLSAASQNMILKLIHPDSSPLTSQTSLQVDFRLASHVLIVNFEVRGQRPVSVNRALSNESSQWGLWDWDVVELFLSVNDDSTYYEFQVSPLGQYFELEIFEPRRRFNKEFQSGFAHSATMTSKDDTCWRAEMRIPLDKLGWNQRIESIRGGAFAILGESETRTYWSAFLQPQKTPDFHLPSYFRALLRFSGAQPT